MCLCVPTCVQVPVEPKRGYNIAWNHSQVPCESSDIADRSQILVFLEESQVILTVQPTLPPPEDSFYIRN